MHKKWSTLVQDWVRLYGDAAKSFEEKTLAL